MKLALFSPKGNYPWNSPAWPEDKSFKTMLEVAQHPYYRTLWQMPEITTYVLIAYSTVGGAAGGDISYWTKGITEAQVAEETSQFLACAQFLLEEYGAEGKTFVFENWEGDWASRAGGYDPSTPATPLALASMTRWLEGRQIGVSLAREAYEARAARAGTEANGKVFFSAEVNLVQDSRMTGAPNMVNRVLPFVSTDMVSYSSYDSMESPVDLKACLEFIAKNHNRTVASPKGNEAIFVAEYVKLLCVCVISVSSSTYFLRLYTTSCPPLSFLPSGMATRRTTCRIQRLSRRSKTSSTLRSNGGQGTSFFGRPWTTSALAARGARTRVLVVPGTEQLVLRTERDGATVQRK